MFKHLVKDSFLTFSAAVDAFFFCRILFTRHSSVFYELQGLIFFPKAEVNSVG